MSVFDGLAQTSATPFDGTGQPETSTQPNLNLSDTSVSRTAALATTALTPVDQLKQGYSQLLGSYYDQIKTAGDEMIRSQAASNQQVSELKGLTSVMQDSTTTPEDYSGAVQASRLAIAQSQQERQQYALEQQAVQNIQNYAASGDTTTATMLLNNLQHGDVAQIVQDTNAKYLIMQREIEKANVASEDQGWFASILSHTIGASSILGIGNSVGEINNVSGIEKHWYDSLVSGNRIGREQQGLWNLSVADFAKAMPDLVKHIQANNSIFGNPDKTAVARVLSQYQAGSNLGLGHDVGQVLDNFGLIGPAELKGLVSVPALLIRNGGRKVAADAVAAAMESVISEGSATAATRMGIPEDDIVRSALPSALNDLGPVSAVSPQEAANNALERGRAAVAAMSNLNAPGRLTADELKAAADKATSKLENDTGRTLQDVQVVPRQLADGSSVHEVQAIVGKANGDGYATAKQAERGARTMGLGWDDGMLVPDESGKFFVRVASPVDETGAFTTNLKPATTGWASRMLKGARELGDEGLLDAAQVSFNTEAQIKSTLQTVYGKPLNALGHNERLALNTITQWGEQNATWLTDDQLQQAYARIFKRTASDKEVAAYRAYQQANDLEYALRNDNIYKGLQTRGMRSVSMDISPNHSLDRANAVVDFNPSEAPKERTYDITNRRHYVDGIDADKVKQLADQGHALVKLDTPVQLEDGTTVKNFIVKKNQLTADLLEQSQLNYRPGGHRIYDGKYFAKQAVEAAQPDTGKTFLKNPNTYIVGRTKAEVKTWADTMEAARRLYLNSNENPGIDALEAIFGGRRGFPSAQEFINGMGDGTYEKAHPFEALYDREMPMAYHSGHADLAFVDPDQTGVNGFLRTNGRLYESRKGEALKDWQGEQAPVLDMFQTMNKAMSNIASMSSLSDYKDQAIKRWYQTYGSYLDNSLNPNASPWEALQKGKFSTKNPELRAVANAGENQRAVIGRVLNWKSDVDREFEQAQRNFENYVMGDDPNSIRNKAGAKVFNWWNDHNPIRSARGFAFDLKLGLFNVAQFPLQIQTMLAATSIEPTAGFRGMVNLMPLRHYLTDAGTEDLLNMYAQRGLPKTMGMATDEWKAMMRQAKNSGFFDVGNSHVLVNSGGPNAAMSMIGSKVNQAREAGRFLFNEGEIWNRGTAWAIAWNEVKKTGLDYGSQEFKNKLAGAAEKYAFNMSSTSRAAWQTGIMSIPTQFWAYNARMLEMMVGRQLTAAQKIRLIAGQTLMYGSAGLPMASLASDYIKNKSMDPNLPQNTPLIGGGKATDINSFYGFLDRGLVDQVIYHMTGADVQVGERAGTGNLLPDLFQQIMGSTKYGPVSPLQLATGATGSTMFQFGKTLADTVKYAAADHGDFDASAMNRDNVLKLFSQASGLGNALKGYMAAKYGDIKSLSGTTLFHDDNLPTSQAAFIALGFQPGQMDKISAMMDYAKHKSAAEGDALKFMGQMDTDWLNQPDRRDDILAKKQLFVSLLPPDIKNDVIKKNIERRAGTSIYDGLVQQYQREVGQNQLNEEVASGGPN